MNFRYYAALYLVNIALMVGIASQESTPGYMDADYYYANGLRIATVGDWNEPFIWNYLGDPQALPHPAFSYWMPLAGIVSAFGIKLTGFSNFWGARIGFIVVAGFLAPLTSHLAFTFTPRKWAATLAGGISLFSGFYFAYLATTETFALYMVFGSIFFLLVLILQRGINQSFPDDPLHSSELGPQVRRLLSPAWVYFVMGFICGLMYLTRVDGIIWFGLGGLAIFLQWNRAKKVFNIEEKFASIHYLVLMPVALFLVSFFLVTSPWINRNIVSYGTLFAPGSGRALWLTSYDEIVAYPASLLTYSRWMRSGFSEIIRARGWALGLNTVTTFAVQGGIILLPFTLIGGWKRRKDWRVILGVCGWLITFVIMSFVFPFQGARGGFFHAGAGFQPLFWALVPVGLSVTINWIAKKRNWASPRSVKMFAAGTVIVMVFMTAIVTRQRLIGSGQTASEWGSTEIQYKEVESFLDNQGVGTDTIVMVNNPPGYYAMTGRPSIVIPHGDLNSALLAGKNFQASYLILDENHPQGLEDIYKNPGDYPGLQYVDTINQMQIYFISQ